uniref:Uncharacterized protein n=1 Tax=Acrobeloides nanus TaxID=290746 RepID=A0A914DBI3_9BILA
MQAYKWYLFNIV